MSRTTLVLGGIAAAVAAALSAWGTAAGVLMGTALAWLNLRWLEQAVNAVAALSVAQANAPKPRISSWTYFKFFARYALIALVLYVTVTRLPVPILSVLGGLLALGAAAMLEGTRDALGKAR